MRRFQFFGKKMKHTAMMAPVALLAAVLILCVSRQAEAAGQTIRVGYIDAGTVTQNEDGGYSGYTADYLEEVAKYTGWKYEYVRGSYADCIEMLRNGELDVFAMLSHIPQWEDQLLFSELSMASTITVMYARADSDIYYQDYAAMDGRAVGVLADSVYLEHLQGYVKEHGLSCGIVTFPTEEEAAEALRRGQIDLFATHCFFDIDGELELQLVDRLEITYAYFATAVDNEKLMAQINEAMQMVQSENYALESELHKAYSTVGETGLYLTREEREYLDSVGPIVVYGTDGQRPLGYTTENGRFAGVLADYLDMLGAVSGLEFVYKTAEASSLSDNLAALEAENAVILFHDRDLAELGLDGVLSKTDVLFETGLAYVRRQGEYLAKMDSHTFALMRELSYLEPLFLDTNSESTLLYYDSSRECMDAVASGEADMAVLDEYVAFHLLQKPKYADTLVHVSGTTYYMDSTCLYATEANRLLVSILNKTMDHVSEGRGSNTISNALLVHSYEYKLEDILYEYQAVIVIVAAAAIVVCLLIWLLRARMAKAKFQEQESELLHHQLWFDELTGLYNRVGFLANARDMIDRWQGDVNIIRMNIYHLKVVNELYGVESGDLLLREIGEKLRQLMERNDMVIGRFTADYFYLCIAADDMDKLDFTRQMTVPGLSMDILLTYGIYPVEGQVDVPLNAMCDRADMANRSAGMALEDYVRWYSDEDRQRLMREQEIEREMERALQEGQFHIYIQPKHNVETEKIVGGEVLVRWFHPEKGVVSPGEFIRIFERNGFIRKLDQYVWEEACAFLARCREAGLPSVPLSVNVSRVHFYGFESIMMLTETVERHGLANSDLELEITESFYAEDPDMIIEKCRLLRGIGFKISMDDFGSGYSSLNMLKEMPVDIIKMDLHFLSGDNDEDQADKGRDILRTLIELAHSLGLHVVVEGLETKSQKDFIQGIGSCAAQGNYFSRPIPAEEFAGLLSEETVDEEGAPAPIQRGNVRRERIRHELREPLMDMIHTGANIFGCLIPEGVGVLPGEMADKTGISPEVDDLETWMTESDLISEASLPLWHELMGTLERGERSGSAIVEMRNKHGQFQVYCLRFDTAIDHEGQPLMAVFTFNDFGSIAAQVQSLVAAKQLALDEAADAENRQLRENEKFLTLVTQHSDRVVCYYDVKNRASRVWNEDICKRCTLPRLCETHVDEMLESGDIMPESVDTLRDMFQEIHEGKAYGQIRMRAKSSEGEPRWFDLQYSTICDEVGQPVSALISNRDITNQYEHEMAYLREMQSISESEQSLGIMEADLNTGLIELQDSRFAPENSSAVGDRLVDFAEHIIRVKMRKEDWADALNFFSPEYLLRQHENGIRLLTRVWPMQFVSGQDSWARFDVELIADPYVGHIRAFIRIWDVTAAKKSQLEIQRRSEEDSMTGLLNHATAEACISAEIDAGGSRGILILLDLDELKQINDAFGHTAGDAAINGIANTLKGHFRESDLIGRIGGDEFIVYMQGAAQNSGIMTQNMTNLLRKLSKLAVGEHKEWGVTCSIGYAVETEGSTYESLFKQADKALYHVKSSGRNNFAKYDPAMEEKDYIFEKANPLSLKSAKKSETSEVRHLIEALTDFYQLVLSINVDENVYYLMEEVKDGVFSRLPIFGELDNFVNVTAARVHPDDVEGFMVRLSRQSLKAANEKGRASIRYTFRFLDLDNRYRPTEATAIFYRDEKDNLCDFTLVKWADDENNFRG